MSAEIKTLNQIVSEPLPRVYYWVQRILPLGGCILLVGDVKTFKSYLSMAIGYDCARGVPVLGRYSVPRPLTVLYVEAEVGPYELKERGSYINVDPAVGGEMFKVISKDSNIQLDTQDGMATLVEAMTATQPDILILDPIVEFHSQNENLAVEMKKMLHPIRRIMNRTNMGLILVHHTAKMSEYRQGNNPQSARGSYFAGMANTIINITKPIPTKDDRIQLDITLRSSRKPPPIRLDFEDGIFKEC